MIWKHVDPAIFNGFQQHLIYFQRCPRIVAQAHSVRALNVFSA
jgi:hypothetical protein